MNIGREGCVVNHSSTIKIVSPARPQTQPGVAEAFESDLAKLCGLPFAVGCNSGTDALWMCMRALGIGAVTLAVEMMPGVVKAVNMEPKLGGKVFFCMIPMMKAFNLKMNFYIMKNVMGMMMGMVVKHPRVIPAMMMAMPKMM